VPAVTGSDSSTVSLASLIPGESLESSGDSTCTVTVTSTSTLASTVTAIVTMHSASSVG
jgi:hypothetical protein